MFDFFTQPKGSEDIYNDKQFACYVVILTIYFNTPLEKYFGLNIFIHISIYSNIQIYILQYNHDGIQKKVMRLIRICFPLNIKVHSLKL